MRVTLLIALSIWNLFGLLSIQRGRIADLNVSCQSGKLMIDCTMGRLDEKQLRGWLEAGEEIEFVYQVDLCQDRESWFNDVSKEVNFRKSLLYNNLTDQYLAVLHQDETKKEELIPADFHAAVKWLTTLRDAPLEYSGNIGGHPYLQVRVQFKKRHLLFLVPLETATLWKRIPVNCP